MPEAAQMFFILLVLTLWTCDAMLDSVLQRQIYCGAEKKKITNLNKILFNRYLQKTSLKWKLCHETKCSVS